MNRPLVSVLINNYNYGRYVSDAIESALGQSYENIEVIVVDDGSTDNSHVVLEKYEQDVTVHFKQNGGQASAFNKGVELSNGDVICFLDADDCFEKNKVITIIDALNSNMELEYVFDKVVRTDTNLKPMDNAIRTNETIYTDLQYAMRSGKLKGREPFIIPATSGLSFRRSIINKIFPIPESESCSMCENYMKYIAVGTSKGAFLDTRLTKQRVHGKNLFTRNKKDKSMAAKISILTGYWLGKYYPELMKFSSTQVALGLSFAMESENIEKKYYQMIIKHLRTLTFTKKCLFLLRACYYYAVNFRSTF